jgi:hypothetical protein
MDIAIGQVRKPDFDMSLLKLSPDEISKIVDEIREIRSADPQFNVRLGLGTQQDFILKRCSLIGRRVMMAALFNKLIFESIKREVGGVLFAANISDCLFQELEIGDKDSIKLFRKIVYDSNVSLDIKHYMFYNHQRLFDHMTPEDFIAIFKGKDGKAESKLFDSRKFPDKKLQELFLDLCKPEDAFIMIKSPIADVRLSAYKKMGMIENLGLMIKDSMSLVRLAAVRILPKGDPRLRSFIDEKARNVFYHFVTKVSSDLLPMIVGNKNLTERYIREAFDRRMNENK